jgi:hypothetical protein
MMATRPLRRITLHLSQIFFTDALTFISAFLRAFALAIGLPSVVQALAPWFDLIAPFAQPMQPRTNS